MNRNLLDELLGLEHGIGERPRPRARAPGERLLLVSLAGVPQRRRAIEGRRSDPRAALLQHQRRRRREGLLVDQRLLRRALPPPRAPPPPLARTQPRRRLVHAVGAAPRRGRRRSAPLLRLLRRVWEAREHRPHRSRMRGRTGKVRAFSDVGRNQGFGEWGIWRRRGFGISSRVFTLAFRSRSFREKRRRRRGESVLYGEGNKMPKECTFISKLPLQFSLFFSHPLFMVFFFFLLYVILKCILYARKK